MVKRGPQCVQLANAIAVAPVAPDRAPPPGTPGRWPGRAAPPPRARRPRRCGGSRSARNAAGASHDCLARLDARVRRRRGREPLAERFQQIARPLDLEHHAARVVDHPARQAERGREPVDGRAKPHALHRAADLEAQSRVSRTGNAGGGHARIVGGRRAGPQAGRRANRFACGPWRPPPSTRNGRPALPASRARADCGRATGPPGRRARPSSCTRRTRTSGSWPPCGSPCTWLPSWGC